MSADDAAAATSATSAAAAAATDTPAAAPAASAAADSGDEAAVKMVTLVSKDGDKFQVPCKDIKISKLVETFLANDAEEGESDDDDPSSEIPLPQVESAVLVKVIEFAKHYSGEKMATIPQPLKDMRDFSANVPAWDAKFIDLELQLLFKLILAAQFMDIRDLLDLTCAKVASVCMKGKTSEEIRKVFNLPKDETPEEKAKLDEMYPFTVKK